MIKIVLKNGALLEKANVILDGSTVVGKVSSGKPLLLNLEERYAYYKIGGIERK